MRCILHIGVEKTGTTSLQEFILKNRCELMASGVATSSALWPGNNRALAMLFQDGLDDLSKTRGYKSIAQQRRALRRELLEFRDEVNSNRGMASAFLVTSEHFHSRFKSLDSIKSLHACLFEIFDVVDVHVYLREQSSLVVSNYSTWLEGGGGDLSLEKFAEEAKAGNPYYDYNLLLGMWSSVFGREHIHPRVYGSSQLLGGDIRRDFLSSVLGLDDCGAFIYPNSRQNRSLGGYGLLFARALNANLSQHLYVGRRNMVRDLLMKGFIASGLAMKGERPGFDRESLKLRFSHSNRMCAREYFEREELFVD
ncbi:MAG: hypothetical protein CME32_00855 [Gimesia sp.]|nr:hypothetical protein [Gimesia sp.]